MNLSVIRKTSFFLVAHFFAGDTVNIFPECYSNLIKTQLWSTCGCEYGRMDGYRCICVHVWTFTFSCVKVGISTQRCVSTLSRGKNTCMSMFVWAEVCMCVYVCVYVCM